MKKIVLFIIILQLGLSCAFSQVTGALDDITVSSDFNLEVDSKKPQVNLALNFDINTMVEKTIITNYNSLNLKPEVLIDLKTVLPEVVESKRTVSAYLNNITEEPVVDFKFKQVGAPDINDWELIVSDASGALFRQFEGKKNFPDSIVWSGRDSKDNMLVPGKWYSYTIKLFDSTGDVYTIPGETFTFPAIFYKEKKYNVVSISVQELFGKDSANLNINKEKLLLLKEAVDYIKRYYPASIEIVVYDMDDLIAERRSEVVAGKVSEFMFLSEDEVPFSGQSAYISDTRVDIIIYK